MTEEEKATHKQQLQQAELALEEMLNSGKIKKRTYFKGQVAIAHDYLLDLNDIVKGLDAIRRCEPEYFLAEQKEDMNNDPVYAQLVIELAKGLVDMQLLDGNPLPRFTQAMAKA